MAVDAVDGKAKGPLITIEQVDRVGTLSLLAVVLARAGADEPTIAEALVERDVSLDLLAYSNGQEGDINFGEIASRAKAQADKERKRARPPAIPVIGVDGRPLWDVTSDTLEAVENATPLPCGSFNRAPWRESERTRKGARSSIGWAMVR